MEIIDINNWNRKEHFKHFSALKDPFFGVVIPFDVTKAYKFSKANNIGFFGIYLHACMKAINDVDALKLRIENDHVVRYETIHASPTIMRDDKSFGFSFVKFHKDLNSFLNNLNDEKVRIKNSNNLYPPVNGLDCIHCSAMPWLHFTGHKEPVSGLVDSVPKLAFSKMTSLDQVKTMNVAISVNHALVDGYDVSVFSEKFQYYLDNYK
jgi:chloramphenicol O-acetyltransferase type A